jgi:hypothetical protein
MGQLLEVDNADVRGMQLAKCLHIKVLIHLQHPLIQGFDLAKVGKPSIRVHFKYERLSEFCFICGRLGHIAPGCPEIPRPINDLPYTASLRGFSLGPLDYSLVHPIASIKHTPPQLYGYTSTTAGQNLGAPSGSSQNQLSLVSAKKVQVNLSYSSSSSQLSSHSIPTRQGKSPLIPSNISDSTVVPLTSPQISKLDVLCCQLEFPVALTTIITTPSYRVFLPQLWALAPLTHPLALGLFPTGLLSAQ